MADCLQNCTILCMHRGCWRRDQRSLCKWCACIEIVAGHCACQPPSLVLAINLQATLISLDLYGSVNIFSSLWLDYYRPEAGISPSIWFCCHRPEAGNSTLIWLLPTWSWKLGLYDSPSLWFSHYWPEGGIFSSFGFGCYWPEAGLSLPPAAWAATGGSQASLNRSTVVDCHRARPGFRCSMPSAAPSLQGPPASRSKPIFLVKPWHTQYLHVRFVTQFNR